MQEVAETPRQDLRRRSTAEDAIVLASRTFNDGRRVEVQDVAAALGVSRVTIYRWLGTREELLAEVVWRLAEPTLMNAYDAAHHEGEDRIASAVSAFVRLSLSHRGMRFFLENESETALRVLTSAISTFQSRLVAALHGLLLLERDAGHISDRHLDLRDLAYLCVRVGESFIYPNAIIGEPADPDRAERALRYLLR